MSHETHPQVPVPRTPVITADMIPEKFRYLFENFETEMIPIYDSDRVINIYRDKKSRYEETLKRLDDEQAKKAEDRDAAQARIDAAKQTLREAERDHRRILGELDLVRYNLSTIRRYIRHALGKIAQREKTLVLTEARRRLSHLGRTIRHNQGRYRRDITGEAAFHIVPVDADHREDGKEKILPGEEVPVMRPITSENGHVSE